MFGMPGITRSTLARLTRSRRIALFPALVLFLMTAPGVAAGAPTVTDLNPPVPDTYTCTPLGNGTICHALTSFSYGPDPAGITCQGAAGPFEVFDEAMHVVDATRWYDRDGNLVSRIRVHTFLDAMLSNPLSGRSVAYSQRDRDEEILAVPGDLGSATTYSTGSIRAVVPGSGAVLIDRGRAVFTDDEMLKLTGRRDTTNYFLNGDASGIAALCAALDG
jgi:hypothetical protein